MSRTAPIVIKQALHCGDDGVRIWGTDIQIVSVVARVRNIRMQSSKITYTIQDITGRMRAVLWIDQEAMEEDVSYYFYYVYQDQQYLQVLQHSPLVADTYYSYEAFNIQLILSYRINPHPRLK